MNSNNYLRLSNDEKTNYRICFNKKNKLLQYKELLLKIRVEIKNEKGFNIG